VLSIFEAVTPFAVFEDTKFKVSTSAIINSSELFEDPSSEGEQPIRIAVTIKDR